MTLYTIVTDLKSNIIVMTVVCFTTYLELKVI